MTCSPHIFESNFFFLTCVLTDNEYLQNSITCAIYFVNLNTGNKAPGSGIAVPLTYNDPGQGRNFFNRILDPHRYVIILITDILF